MNATVRDTLQSAVSPVPLLPEDSTTEACPRDSLYLLTTPVEETDTACQSGTDEARLPQPYPEGFFAQSPHLHLGSTRHEAGYDAVPLATHPWSDDWLTGTILILLATMILMLRRSARQLYGQAQLFLLPSRSREANADTQPLIGMPITVFSVFLLSFTEACVAMWYFICEQEIFLGYLSPYLLFFLITLLFLAAMAAKFMAYRFVNWIFFDRQKKLTWHENYKLLLIVESVLLFLVIVFGTYFCIPPRKVLWMVVYILVFVKFLLLIKSYQIFFADFHGLFHEIIYLCTLEATPIAVAVKILIQVTRKLNVFF